MRFTNDTIHCERINFLYEKWMIHPTTSIPLGPQERGSAQKSPSTTQILTQMVLHRHVSLVKHHPFDHQVARIDHEPPDEHESACAGAHPLAKGDAP